MLAKLWKIENVWEITLIEWTRKDFPFKLANINHHQEEY